MEEQKVKKRRRRRKRKKSIVEEVKIPVEQMSFSSYEQLTEQIDAEMERMGIGTRAETIRILLEDQLLIPEEVRNRYREQVTEARKRAGRTASKPEEARRILRKNMKPKTWYTRQELAEIAGVSRLTVERAIKQNYKYFTVDNKTFGNNRIVHVIRLKSKKERETGIEEDIPYERET